MRTRILTAILLIYFLLIKLPTWAQCSICTKTAEQLGDGPAAALNNAILYLMLAPLIIIFYLGYTWWKKEKTITEK